MTKTTRTSLYSASILGNAVYSAIWLGLLFLAAAGGAVGLTFALAEAASNELVALWWVGGIAGVVLFALAAFHVVALAICVGAWRGHRSCAYGLIVISALRLMAPDPISLPLGVVTLVGAIQSLDRTRSVAPA